MYEQDCKTWLCSSFVGVLLSRIIDTDFVAGYIKQVGLCNWPAFRERSKNLITFRICFGTHDDCIIINLVTSFWMAPFITNFETNFKT